MSTKFAVPFLVLGLVAFGCSSSDTPTPGTGGSSAGGRGGTTGTAGRGGTTGTAGTGGTTGTAGSGGTTGTAGSGGTTGTAGTGGTTGTAGSGGGTAGAGGRGGAGGGTAGSGGGTAGAGGRGGAGGGTAGSGGGTAGTGGGTAGSGGGTAGAGGRGGAGGTAGTGGGAGGAANTAAELKAMCMSDAGLAAAGTRVFSPADFCTLYLATCTAAATGMSVPAGYADRAECEASFALITTQGHCRSYHLCNATGTGQMMTHCKHSTGTDLCTGN